MQEALSFWSMIQVRMTEAEFAGDVRGVLDKVQQGVEIVVEHEHRPVAVIRSPAPKGRLLSECIALAEARGSAVTLDEGFMKDVEEGIERRSQSWTPPSWE
jgi:antitoxin (DNA-binding transcriptional repressor) of toxin-antitoxin stability system